ncbi:hypothetical protein LUX57_41905 [Actinomadura madurae]|nr:hypothetical protein [Actinomadura madurae]MCP9970909.1 hypothetical protein [Actinomadura madurae]MCP9983385.1 hypothetical protein [Actinomadura madurae]
MIAVSRSMERASTAARIPPRPPSARRTSVTRLSISASVASRAAAEVASRRKCSTALSRRLRWVSRAAGVPPSVERGLLRNTADAWRSRPSSTRTPWPLGANFRSSVWYLRWARASRPVTLAAYPHSATSDSSGTSSRAATFERIDRVRGDFM